MPGRDRAEAVALGVNVEQIGPAVDGRALGAVDRAFEIARLLDGLAFDAEAPAALAKSTSGLPL